MSDAQDTFDLDSFDVDRAFDDLARNVTAASPGRGAQRAIARSRRRRAAGGVVAAVAVVAAGGIGFAALGEREQVPVAPDVSDAVHPAPLDAAALAEATDPWVQRWSQDDSQVLTDAPCLDAGSSEPVASDSEEFRSGSLVGASRVYAMWESAGQATKVGDRLTQSLAGCAQSQPSQAELQVPGASVSSFSFPKTDDVARTVWVAVSGARVGILTIAGVEAPPAQVEDEVAEALVAGLLDED